MAVLIQIIKTLVTIDQTLLIFSLENVNNLFVSFCSRLFLFISLTSSSTLDLLIVRCRLCLYMQKCIKTPEIGNFECCSKKTIHKWRACRSKKPIQRYLTRPNEIDRLIDRQIDFGLF